MGSAFWAGKTKGFPPGYTTRDKDLVFPDKTGELPISDIGIVEADGPDGDDELVDVLKNPEEPDRRPRGMPRAHGSKWEDSNLPPAPEGWSPRNVQSRRK